MTEAKKQPRQQLTCKRCGYSWYTRGTAIIGIPTVCPGCKSPYWHKDKLDSSKKHEKKAVQRTEPRKRYDTKPIIYEIREQTKLLKELVKAVKALKRTV